MENITLIKNIKINKNIVSATIEINNDINNIWYKLPYNIDNKTINPANAIMIIALPVAMKTSKKLIIEGKVSKKLIEQLHEYQKIMKKWYKELNIVEIIYQDIVDDINENKQGKTICCFTGGVDAFYSTLKNISKIDDLLYVWGFDIPLSEANFYKKVETNLKLAASRI